MGGILMSRLLSRDEIELLIAFVIGLASATVALFGRGNL